MSERSHHTVLLEVEEALGPGLDYTHDAERGIVVSGSRAGGLWLGVDRAFLVDSDDGRGRRVPVLVALPSSSFAGARIDAELVGGYADPSGLVLVARLDGTTVPIDEVVRATGGIGGNAPWIDARHAAERASAARRAFRERRGRGRITGGQAWRPPEGVSAELLRAGGVYSKAERSLDRLPPRYLRGLEGMLDPDERLHYSIQRPWRTDAGLMTRVRGTDRRSGLLLLTDRQILWIVDHANPDSYLSDWGVDVDLAPVEQLTAVAVEDSGETLRLVFDTVAGRRVVGMPVELEADIRIFEALASQFVPERNVRRLRRMYETKPVEFVEETAERFGQLPEALALCDAAREQAGELLAFVYSPKREGQRDALGLWLSPTCVGLLGPRPEQIELRALAAATMAISPLTARIALRAAGRSVSFPYPGPLASYGAAFVRALRRAWANTTT